MTDRKNSQKVGALMMLSALTVSGQALAQTERHYLTRIELEKTLVGKAHTFKHLSSGGLFQWDVREGGRIYSNNRSNSNRGGNASGTWELRDDGGLCIRWAAAPSDAMGCAYFFKEGENLQRTSTPDPASSVNAIVTAIE